MKKTRALGILTSVAMTLPGISRGLSQVPILKPQAEAKYTYWDEGKGHYKIDLYQLNAAFPLKEGVSDLSITAVRDVMSGASSRFPVPGALLNDPIPNNELAEYVTEASISDTRSDINARARYFFEDSSAALQLGYSVENDYKAYYANLSPEFSFNKNNTILNLGAGVSRDSINPTNGKYPFFLDNKVPFLVGHKTSQQYSVSLLQYLTPKSYVQQNVEFRYDKGLLHDPYKRVSIWGDATATRPGSFYLDNFNNTFINTTFDYDRRPSTRSTWLFTTRYVQYVEAFDSSVHFGYRYGTNSWSVNSHTFRLSYHQPFSEGWEVVPSLRYYSQNRAKFYSAAFSVEPNSPYPAKPLDPYAPATSDYRLASYGSIGGELQVSKVFMEDYKATFIIGHIKRDPSWTLGKSDDFKRPYNNYKTTYASVQLKVLF